MLKVVIEGPQSFRIKEIDENGSTVRLLEEVFESQDAAEAFINLDKKPEKVVDSDEVKVEKPKRAKKV